VEREPKEQRRRRTEEEVVDRKRRDRFEGEGWSSNEMPEAKGRRWRWMQSWRPSLRRGEWIQRGTEEVDVEGRGRGKTRLLS